MNKLLFSTIFLLLSTKIIVAQGGGDISARLKEANNDTIKYMKEYIIGQNDKYVNKPFETLVKDLPTKIGYYSNSMSNRPEIFTGTTFRFYTHNEIESKKAKKENPLIIVITWKKQLTATELSSVGLKWGGKWSDTVHNFFRDRIIEKVDIVHFDF